MPKTSLKAGRDTKRLDFFANTSMHEGCKIFDEQWKLIRSGVRTETAFRMAIDSAMRAVGAIK